MQEAILHVVRVSVMNFFDMRILEIGVFWEFSEKNARTKSTKQQQQPDDNECNSTNPAVTVCAGQRLW